jgi:hypothetical protein
LVFLLHSLHSLDGSTKLGIDVFAAFLHDFHGARAGGSEEREGGREGREEMG